MLLGIDFGTTRVVVAAVDRGNYPVVRFETPDDTTEDWFPLAAALRGPQCVYGWEAWSRRLDSEWRILWSPQRRSRLSDRDGPETGVQKPRVQALLRGLLEKFRSDLYRHSTLDLERGEELEVYLGVPSQTRSARRLVAADLFREAGFQVLGLSTEPYAAAVEFYHHSPAVPTTREGACLLVYNLGEHTFDASLIRIGTNREEILGVVSLQDMGADRFDEALVTLAFRRAGIPDDSLGSLSYGQRLQLLDHCRHRWQCLRGDSRRIVVDLGVAWEDWREVPVCADDLQAACLPLIGKTLRCMTTLLDEHRCSLRASGPSGGLYLDAVYMAGAGSEFPLVYQALRDAFGARVRRSASPHCSPAVGLAILAENASGHWTCPRELIPGQMRR